MPSKYYYSRAEISKTHNITVGKLERLFKKENIKFENRITTSDYKKLCAGPLNPIYLVDRNMLANYYQISDDTLRKELKKLNIRPGKQLRVVDLKLIYSKMGIPQPLQKKYPNECKKFKKKKKDWHAQFRKLLKKRNQHVKYVALPIVSTEVSVAHPGVQKKIIIE